MDIFKNLIKWIKLKENLFVFRLSFLIYMFLIRVLTLCRPMSVIWAITLLLWGLWTRSIPTSIYRFFAVVSSFSVHTVNFPFTTLARVNIRYIVSSIKCLVFFILSSKITNTSKQKMFFLCFSFLMVFTVMHQFEVQSYISILEFKFSWSHYLLWLELSHPVLWFQKISHYDFKISNYV